MSFSGPVRHRFRIICAEGLFPISPLASGKPENLFDSIGQRIKAMLIELVLSVHAENSHSKRPGRDRTRTVFLVFRLVLHELHHLYRSGRRL